LFSVNNDAAGNSPKIEARQVAALAMAGSGQTTWRRIFLDQVRP